MAEQRYSGLLAGKAAQCLNLGHSWSNIQSSVLVMIR